MKDLKRANFYKNSPEFSEGDMMVNIGIVISLKRSEFGHDVKVSLLK